MGNYTRKVILPHPDTGEPMLYEVDQASASGQRTSQANYGNRVTYNQNPQLGGPTFAVDPNTQLTPQVAGIQTTFDGPTPITIYCGGTLSDSPVSLTVNIKNLIPVAVVTWGLGGITHTMIVDATLPRGKASIVAEFVDIKVALQATAGQTTIASNVQCIFDIEVGEGVDPDFVHNSKLIASPVPLTNAANAVAGPARVRSISAWDSNTTGGNFLMLFDAQADPCNGATPKITWPLTATPGVLSVDDELGTDLTFQFGVWWAVSSTSGTLTNVPAAAARVDITIDR
jgi:hypothetical protein